MELEKKNKMETMEIRALAVNRSMPMMVSLLIRRSFMLMMLPDERKAPFSVCMTEKGGLFAQRFPAPSGRRGLASSLSQSLFQRETARRTELMDQVTG